MGLGLQCACEMPNCGVLYKKESKEKKNRSKLPRIFWSCHIPNLSYFLGQSVILFAVTKHFYLSYD